MIWKSNNQYQKNRGFSLLEVMVAITVLAVALISVISVLISSMVLNQNSRESNIATIAARGKLEEIQLMNFADIKNNLTVVGTEKIYAPPQSSALLQPDFDVPGLNVAPQDASGDPQKNGFFKIISTAPNGNDKLVEIQIIIEWRSSNGRSQKLEIWGRRSDRGAI